MSSFMQQDTVNPSMVNWSIQFQWTGLKLYYCVIDADVTLKRNSVMLMGVVVKLGKLQSASSACPEGEDKVALEHEIEVN